MIYITFIGVLLLVDALTALVTSGSVYQIHSTVQNSLYLFATCCTLSLSFAPIIDPSVASLRLEWFFFRLVAIFFFAASTCLCGYTAIVIFSHIAAQTPPLHVALFNPGDWVGVGAFRASILLIFALVGVLEVVFGSFAVGYELGGSGYHRTMSLVAKKNSKGKKWQTQCLGGLWVLFVALLVASEALAFVLLFFSFAASKHELWQQCDAPHASLVFCLGLAWRLGTFSRPTLVLYVTIFAVALAISAAHLFFEVERVNINARWLSLSSYEAVFNTSSSTLFLDLYRFENISPTFIEGFAFWSTTLHLIHVFIVAFGAAVFFSTVFVALGLFIKREGCLFFYDNFIF